MATEAEHEQAVIERWTGKQEPASFRIRAYVGTEPIFRVKRFLLTASGRRKQICINRTNMVPVPIADEWNRRTIEFIRTT